MPRPHRFPGRAVLLLPLGFLLGGCGLEPEYAWVDVHNHTETAVVARDADWEKYDDCGSHESSRWTLIPPHAVRRIGIDVDFYDADIEIDGDGGRRVYDLDFAPFEFYEDLHVRDADFAPAGNG